MNHSAVAEAFRPDGGHGGERPDRVDARASAHGEA